MTPILKVKPGVVLTGIRPEITRVDSTVVAIFGRHGYDCWLTSAIRPKDSPASRLGDSSLHDDGLAEDFDSSTNIPESVGKEIERSVRAHLGDSYDVVWHGPYWHLHVEFHPD